MTALSWLALLAWASLTFLASAATGSTMAAAGLGFVALVGLGIVALVPAVDRFLPTGLSAQGSLMAIGDWAGVDGGRLATAVAGTLALLGAALAGAVVSFRRREL